MMDVVLFILPFALGVLLAANVIHDRYESAIWIAVLALSMWIGFHYEPQFRQAAIRSSNYQSYIDYRNEYNRQNNPQYRYQYVGDNMYEKVRVNY